MQDIRVQVSGPDGRVIASRLPPGTPRTSKEYLGLMHKREELSEQLESAKNRRDELSEQHHAASPAARLDIEARSQALDQRIIRLESEIDRIGDQLANAPVSVMTGTAADPTRQLAERASEDLVAIVSIVSVFFLAPFAIALSRLIWKRAGGPARSSLAEQAATQRLDQLQRAVDTIAIEVERISEGQRFVSKLLSQKDRHALGVGAAEAPLARKSAAAETL